MRQPKLSKDDVIEKLDSIRERILNGEDAKPLAGALNALIWDLQGMVEWEDDDMTDWRHDNYFGPNEFTNMNMTTHDMSNKEALEIVLKLAKSNTLAKHDIMYSEQEEQYKRVQQAIQTVEAYLDYDENIRED